METRLIVAYALIALLVAGAIGFAALTLSNRRKRRQVRRRRPWL